MDSKPERRKGHKGYIAIACGAMLLVGVAGCEDTTIIGEGNNIENGDRNRPGTVVNGFLTKGPVDGASCSLYTSGNVRLAGPVETSDGEFSFGRVEGLISGDHVYLNCAGGTYTDEATGETMTLTTLRGGQTVSGNSFTQVVSPLTEIAYNKSRNDLSQIDQHNLRIGKALGLSDGINPVSVIPQDLTIQVSQGGEAGQYGTWLALFSQLQQDGVFGNEVSSVTSKLEACINGESLDATCVDRLQTAMDNLLANSQAPVVDRLDPQTVTTIRSNLNEHSNNNRIITIDNVTPASIVVGQKAPENWRIIGSGLDMVTSVSFYNSHCASSGSSNADGTRLDGVDCSNVTVPEGGNVSLTFRTSDGVEVDFSAIEFGTAPQAAFSEWSLGGDMSLAAGSPFFDQTVSITGPTGCSGAVITYSIEPENDVASIDEATGRVIPVASIAQTQIATVTATTDGIDGICTFNTASYDLTVTNQLINVPTFADPGPIEKEYGDATFVNAATCTFDPSGDLLRYSSSSNNAPITVGGSSGTVTIQKAGSAMVTATCGASGNYIEGISSYTVDVAKAPMAIAFSQSNRSLSYDLTADINPYIATIDAQALVAGDTINDVGGTITYTSSNLAVATVDENSGEITITNPTPGAAGSDTSIIATLSGAGNYEDASTDYLLTIVVP